MLRRMALGLMPDVMRVADGPLPEAHVYLIRGMLLYGFLTVLAWHGMLQLTCSASSFLLCTLKGACRCTVRCNQLRSRLDACCAVKGLAVDSAALHAFVCYSDRLDACCARDGFYADHQFRMCVYCCAITSAGMALSKSGLMIVGDSVRVGQRVRFISSSSERLACCCSAVMGVRRRSRMSQAWTVQRLWATFQYVFQGPCATVRGWLS